MSVKPSIEQRAAARDGRQNQVTGLLQMILHHPREAGDMLERDLRDGGDPHVLLGLLDAAEAILQLRGVEITTQFHALRKRIERNVR